MNFFLIFKDISELVHNVLKHLTGLGDNFSEL